MSTHRALILTALLAACSNPERNFTRDSGRNNPMMDASGDGPAETCEPGRIYCEGVSASYRCTSDGIVTARTMCTGAESTCAPGLGCRVCVPDAVRCDPSMPDRTQRCRGDGTGWDNGPVCAGSGAYCAAGVCLDRCSAATQGRSYLGCDYWPVTLPNSGLDPNFYFAVVLSNPQSYDVNAEITGGSLAEPRSITLAPNAIEVVRLPWVVPLVQLNPNCPRLGDRCLANDPARSALQRGGAYHVRTDGPIAAYQFNPLTFQESTRFFSYSNDASLLLPQGVLTQRYTVITWPNFEGRDFVFGGFASIVATTGETTNVTVRVAGRVRAGAGVPAMARGETRTFTLTEGDVLQLVGEGSGDLTGSTIEADHPVAVYVGHDCTNVPFDRVACDHLEEQLLPNETWGSDYFVSHLRDRGPTQPATVRILSRADGNAITFDPPVFRDSTLESGGIMEFQTTQHFRVTGSGPFVVAQFMQGQGPSLPGQTGAGDPAMVLEVPVQQFRTRYDFYVPSTYPRNFINIVVPTGAQAFLDDQPVRGSMEVVGNYTVYTLPIDAGSHRMRSDGTAGFGIKVYGIASYTSYTYPGGMDLQLLTPG